MLVIHSSNQPRMTYPPPPSPTNGPPPPHVFDVPRHLLHHLKQPRLHLINILQLCLRPQPLLVQPRIPIVNVPLDTPTIDLGYRRKYWLAYKCTHGDPIETWGSGALDLQIGGRALRCSVLRVIACTWQFPRLKLFHTTLVRDRSFI